MIKTIFRKLGIENDSETQKNIVHSCFFKLFKIFQVETIHELIKFNIPIFERFKNLSVEETNFLEQEKDFIVFSTRDCQLLVQKEISKGFRKELAAFFTNDEGLNLMASLVKKYDKKTNKSAYIIADPFMGAARTLVSAVKSLGKTKIKKIFGIERYYLSGLVGYIALLECLNGNYQLLDIHIGDAFSEVSKLYPVLELVLRDKIDIILTNPPFTRWKYLDTIQRKNLILFTKNFGYFKYIKRKEMGLQIFSLFLCDYILNKKGLLVSVLPLSTFYTIGGDSSKKLFKDNYSVLSLVESGVESAFSEDSGFKEVIIICIKGRGKIDTLFTKDTEDQNLLAELIFNQKENSKSMNYYDLSNIPKYLNNNWFALFENNEVQRILIDFINKGLKNNSFDYWNNVIGGDKIVRGFEMYGPKFFFLPNDYWSLKQENSDSIIVKNNDSNENLIIEKKYLVKSLSKPSLYYRNIIPKVDTYVLSIPPIDLEELPGDLRKYIECGIKSNTPKPAIKAFGKYWYSHINKCMQTKEPFANLFISDKVDLNFAKRSVFANFSMDSYSASKNFYLVKDIDKKISKCISAWLNSSIFLAILLIFSRKISNTWTRLLRDDYLKLPIINISKFDDSDIKQINEAFEKIISNNNLPPLWEQFEKEYRYNLDLKICKALKLPDCENFVKNLHKSLVLYKNTILNQDNMN